MSLPPLTKPDRSDDCAGPSKRFGRAARALLCGAGYRIFALRALRGAPGRWWDPRRLRGYDTRIPRLHEEPGNDLSTPVPEFGFPGLSPGDRWCLCASRWQEAFEAGVAPPVVLAATHEAALRIVDREDFESRAVREDQEG